MGAGYSILGIDFGTKYSYFMKHTFDGGKCSSSLVLAEGLYGDDSQFADLNRGILTWVGHDDNYTNVNIGKLVKSNSNNTINMQLKYELRQDNTKLENFTHTKIYEQVKAFIEGVLLYSINNDVSSVNFRDVKTVVIGTPVATTDSEFDYNSKLKGIVEDIVHNLPDDIDSTRWFSNKTTVQVEHESILAGYSYFLGGEAKIPDGNICVIDIGAGTSDVSVLCKPDGAGGHLKNVTELNFGGKEPAGTTCDVAINNAISKVNTVWDGSQLTVVNDSKVKQEIERIKEQIYSDRGVIVLGSDVTYETYDTLTRATTAFLNEKEYIIFDPNVNCGNRYVPKGTVMGTKIIKLAKDAVIAIDSLSAQDEFVNFGKKIIETIKDSQIRNFLLIGGSSKNVLITRALFRGMGLQECGDQTWELNKQRVNVFFPAHYSADDSNVNNKIARAVAYGARFYPENQGSRVDMTMEVQIMRQKDFYSKAESKQKNKKQAMVGTLELVSNGEIKSAALYYTAQNTSDEEGYYNTYISHIYARSVALQLFESYVPFHFKVILRGSKEMMYPKRGGSFRIYIPTFFLVHGNIDVNFVFKTFTADRPALYVFFTMPNYVLKSVRECLDMYKNGTLEIADKVDEMCKETKVNCVVNGASSSRAVLFYIYNTTRGYVRKYFFGKGREATRWLSFERSEILKEGDDVQ